MALGDYSAMSDIYLSPSFMEVIEIKKFLKGFLKLMCSTCILFPRYKMAKYL